MAFSVQAVMEAMPYLGVMAARSANTSLVPSGSVEQLLEVYDRERMELPPPVSVWEWGFTKSAETWNGRFASACFARLALLRCPTPRLPQHRAMHLPTATAAGFLPSLCEGAEALNPLTSHPPHPLTHLAHTHSLTHPREQVPRAFPPPRIERLTGSASVRAQCWRCSSCWCWRLPQAPGCCTRWVPSRCEPRAL